MARKPDVQYIRYQIDGTAARKLETVQQPEQKRQAKKVPEVVIGVDPLAICGIVVGIILLFLMITSVQTLRMEQAQLQQMQKTVQTMKAENISLSASFESELDLDQIRTKALALGMVPVEEVTHISIQVSPPVEEVVPEPTTLERVQTFFAELFA